MLSIHSRRYIGESPVFAAHFKSCYWTDIQRRVTNVHLVISSFQSWVIMQIEFFHVFHASDVGKVSAVFKFLLIQQQFQDWFLIVQAEKKKCELLQYKLTLEGGRVANNLVYRHFIPLPYQVAITSAVENFSIVSIQILWIQGFHFHCEWCVGLAWNLFSSQLIRQNCFISYDLRRMNASLTVLLK